MSNRILGMIGMVVLVGFITTGIIQQQLQEETTEELVIVEEPINEACLENEVKQMEAIEIGEEVIKAYDDIPLTCEEQKAMYDKCEELGVSYWFMLALLESESGYRADAVGDHGRSIGYMQINEVNWYRMKKDYGLDVFEPIENIYAGIYMVKELMDKYDTIEEVIMGYKCGESRMRDYIRHGVTLECVEDVTNRAIELENNHRKEN